MPLRRGVVYALESPRPTGLAIGAVVLTNDTWNEKMEEVGVVFVAEPRQEGTLLPVVSRDPPLQAAVAQPRTWPKAWLGAPLVVLDAEALARIEDGLCGLLAFPALFADPPYAPRPPGGRVTYPAWGNLYYIRGEQYGGEHKRYLVVSHDHWNAHAAKVLAVRTTTRSKWPTTSFPHIQSGTAQACCGNLNTFAAERFELQRTFREPWLSLADVRAVAEGIIETHGLEEAVARCVPR